MKKRNAIYLFIILLTCSFLVTCNKSTDDNDNPPSATPTADLPVFKEGDIVNSDFYVDDVLREQMIDTIVNFGSLERPALFYVNQEHTLDGEPMEVGNHSSNIFRSLVRGDIYKFIVLWGQVHNLDIDIADTSASAVELRQNVFHDLQAFILYHDLDFPLLVSLANDEGGLKSAIRWANAATELSLSGVELADQNTPDHIFRAMEIKGLSLSEVSAVLQSNGMTEKEFLKMAQDKGLDLERTLMQMTSPRQTVVCLVALGCKVVTTWLLRFINNGAPIVNLENSYASYLNNADTVVMDYYTGATMNSPVYTVRYGTKNNPLVEAKFYVTTYYRAYHASLPGLYLNRVGMVVSSIHCSGTMHLDGSVDYNIPFYEGSGDDLVVWSTAMVDINYGDCCAVKRTGRLSFWAYGDTGYKQMSWDPQW